MKEYNRKKWMGITLTISTLMVAVVIGLVLMVIYAFYTPSSNDSNNIYLILSLVLVLGGGYGVLVMLFNKYTWIYHLLFFLTFVIVIFVAIRDSFVTTGSYALIFVAPYIIFYIRDLFDKLLDYKNYGGKK